MKNPYRELTEGIHAPAGLHERVIRTAERGRPSRRLARRSWMKPALRGAVCTVCALALVLGTVELRPSDSAPAASSHSAGSGAMQLGYSFGLTALAADTGDRAVPKEGGIPGERVVPEPHREDGKLAFASGQGSASPEDGDYTGILFQITGEGIAHVSMSLDRGGFYRYRLHDNLTKEQMREYCKAEENGEIEVSIASQDENGVWYIAELEALGNTVSEAYDPGISYGFWVSPEEYIPMDDPNVDLRQRAWENIDLFDGGTLTVAVTFEDGSEQMREYRLHTGRLRVEYRDDLREMVVLPEVVPVAKSSELPFIYGIYTEPVD